MLRRFCLLILPLGLALGLLAPAASAKVTILDSDGNQVDTIAKAKCLVTGSKGSQDFFAAAKSQTGMFLLTVFIDAPVFQGFDDDYTIFYGGGGPQVFLNRRSDDEVFSNFKIPGTPAGTVAGGGIKFGRGGRTMGVGLAPASNKSFTEGYSFAGVLPCKYRKGKKRTTRDQRRAGVSPARRASPLSATWWSPRAL